MNDALQQHGHCLLPGIGLLRIARDPAEKIYRENSLHPPAFRVILDPLPGQQPSSFFSIVQQIAFARKLPAAQAAETWAKTAAAMKDKLSAGSSISLDGLGLLNLDEDSRISFTAAQPSHPVYEARPLRNAKNQPSPPPSDTGGEQHTENITAAPPPVLTGEPARRQARSRWWITGSIIALLLVGWFTYKGTRQRRERASAVKHILRDESLNRNLAADDSLKITADPVPQPAAIQNDSIHYKIVFAIYTHRDKALHQFHKMKNWGHPVVLITKDPGHYELAMPFTSLPHDTTVNLVKMMKLYGNKVHIEYDRK